MAASSPSDVLFVSNGLSLSLFALSIRPIAVGLQFQSCLLR